MHYDYDNNYVIQYIYYYPVIDNIVDINFFFEQHLHDGIPTYILCVY